MTRAAHLFLQAGSGVALPVHHAHADRGGQSAVLHRQPEADARELQLPEFHVLVAIADGPDVRLDCSCGWLSGCYSSEQAARRILGNECPVEFIRAQSAQRRKAMQARLGAGR